MQDEIDVFEFVLARELKLTLSEVRAMPNSEYVEWRAFYTWENAMAKKKGG